MSNYKLVPVGLLKDWHKRINTIATATAFNVADEMGAMLTAAPVVRGEPTRQYYYKVNSCKALSPDSDQCICWHYEGEGPLADGSAKSWRVAPIKPAEQQPDDSAAVRLDKQCRQDVAAALGFPSGGNYAWSYLLQQIKDAVSVAEQKPDVAQLVEARDDAMRFALPEVVAWWDGESNITRKVGRPAAHNWHQRIDLIRLSDYKALQAECEKLRKDAERYRWLREYFCSTREDLDDLLVEACGDNDPSKLDGVIEAALAELKRQNKQPIERNKS